MAAGECEPAKRLLPYLQRADELQKHDPKVAYYCRLHAMELGLKIPKKERTKTTNDILVSLMKQLEKDKKSITLGPEDQSHVESFSLNVFAKADKQDRAGRADLNTAKTFYAAAIFFDVLSQFGDLQPDIEEKQKYAAWKAADIRKAIKEGRKPEPGPPGGNQDYFSDPSTAPATIDDSGRHDAFPTQSKQDTSTTPDTYKQSSPVPSSRSFSASYPPAGLPPSVDMHRSVSSIPKEPPSGSSSFTSTADHASSIDAQQTVPDDYEQPAPSQLSVSASPATNQASFVTFPSYPQAYNQPSPQEHHEPPLLPPQPLYPSHDMANSYSIQPPPEEHQELPGKQHYPSDDMVNPFACQPPPSVHHAPPSSQSHHPSPVVINSFSYPSPPQEHHEPPPQQQHYFSEGMVNSYILYGHQSYTDNNPAMASAPPTTYDQSVGAGHVGASFIQQPNPRVQGIPPSNEYSPASRNGTATQIPQASAAFIYDCNYQPPPDKAAEAQKAARFAVGALAFDEVPVAVDFLRRALELLTNPSATIQ